MRHNSKRIYLARIVDTICGPQTSFLKQIMCFIVKEIRDTDQYDWKVFLISFRMKTFAQNSSVSRNVNLFRCSPPPFCLFFFFFLTDDAFLLFFLSYIRFRDFFFSIRLPICGRNCSVMRGECSRSASFELFCTVRLESLSSNTYCSHKGRHFRNKLVW